MARQITAYIGLGSNLQDRRSFIDKALQVLAETEQVKVRRIAEPITTAPLDNFQQPEYLNTVAELTTSLSAEGLLKKTQQIEANLGRTREKKWAPRTIDLDLLLYGSQKIHTPLLTVPHPQMHLRSFVLEPLCRLDPNILHPGLNRSVAELAERLNNHSFAFHPELPRLISIAGLIGVGKTTLTEKLAKFLNADTILEPYDENPFLPELYRGNVSAALDSQLFFLTARAEQLDKDALAPARTRITDYAFAKELIYAKIFLNSDQLRLYEKIYPPFADRVASPSLFVYLEDSPSNCLERIHSRNRPYEQNITLDFLRRFSNEYDNLYRTWSDSPRLRLSASQVHRSGEPGLGALAREINFYLAGKNNFSPD